jgi:hypothetical protein
MKNVKIHVLIQLILIYVTVTTTTLAVQYMANEQDRAY